MPELSVFSASYAEARGKFIDAARAAGATVYEYRHPTPETLSRLERLPARIYRTDRDGTVTVETDGARIQVTTARGKREILEAR